MLNNAMTTRNMVEKQFHQSSDLTCREAKGAMISTAHPGATKAGVKILQQGGNAVDAAVAAAFALCVCESQACSLGGQSYALMQMDGTIHCLEGTGHAPLHQNIENPSHSEILNGYRGTTVPTTPALLASMHARSGRLSWEMVLDPAIKLAQEGFVISQLQHDLQTRELSQFLAIPGGSGARYFLKNGKEPYAVGDLFRQPELAVVLERLAQHGIEDFYIGETGRRIAKDMQAHNGFLSYEDLINIPWPHERPAIEYQVFNHRLVTMPPPTQGRLLLYILAVAERLDKAGHNLCTPQSIPLLADLFASAYQIRKRYNIHPDYYSFAKDSVFRPDSLDQEAEALYRAQTHIPALELAGGETTHLSVMDKEGNCVGITQSVNMVYGSRAAAEGLGFLYNNYLIDAFSLDHSNIHGMTPGKTAPCSVAPFLLMDQQNMPWIIGGSPGSERIVTALSLFLLNILQAKMPMDTAMRSPRFHCLEQGTIYAEANRFDESILSQLRTKGYKVEEKPSFYFGAVHAVLKKHDSQFFQGVAEQRRDGIAAGAA